ncbi:hypothetical protein ACWERV_33785, partial [Streptomyces sp. NPDC004031]
LPMRARLEEGRGFGRLLSRVRETTLDAYAHQDGAMAEHLESALGPADDDTAEPVLRELERLEAAVAQERPAGEAGSRLVKRLQDLLWRLGDGATAAEADGGSGQEALESASDEEMFALIDQQLGSS